MCPECKREYYRNWHATNKQRRNAYQRGYGKENPDKKKAWIKRSRTDLKCYLSILVNRASRSKHTFQIDIDHLLSLWAKQNGRCALSGLLMIHAPNQLKSCSLDRKDSNDGYTKNNTQLVCKWINLAKNNHSDNELRTVLIELIDKGEL